MTCWPDTWAQNYNMFQRFLCRCCVNDFDFQTALAPQRGANFAGSNFIKSAETFSFQRFWLPNSSRATAWCKFGPHLGQPILRTPFLGADFPGRQSHKTVENTQHFAQFLSAKSINLSCITPARSHLLVDRSSAATLSIVLYVRFLRFLWLSLTTVYQFTLF